jgi:Domain of unknown function (DUF6817)/2OG-Fe(II) oxygenase superfamily
MNEAFRPAAAIRAAVADRQPFDHAVIDELLTEAEADALLDWFEGDAVWQLQQRTFYTQHSCFNTDELRAGPLRGMLSADGEAALGEALGKLFGLDLAAERIHVEAHRLLPGEGIGLHNDNPILGTESVRLVSHYNRGFDDRQGGHLVMFASDDDRDIRKVIRPLHNSAVAFPLGPRSFHAVADVRDGARYSLVLGFFEKGRVPTSHVLTIGLTGDEQLRLRAVLPDLDSLVVALCDLGADRLPHGDVTLVDHLVATAALTARWECSADVCRAALFHSVLGSTATEQPLVGPDGWRALEELIGTRAYRLVSLYRTTRFGDVYRESGETAYRAIARDGSELLLDPDDVLDLNLIAWANRLAHGELEIDHDGWQQFVEVFGKLSDAIPAAARRDLEPLSQLPDL